MLDILYMLKVYTAHTTKNSVTDKLTDGRTNRPTSRMLWYPSFTLQCATHLDRMAPASTVVIIRQLQQKTNISHLYISHPYISHLYIVKYTRQTSDVEAELAAVGSGLYHIIIFTTTTTSNVEAGQWLREVEVVYTTWIPKPPVSFHNANFQFAELLKSVIYKGAFKSNTTSSA